MEPEEILQQGFSPTKRDGGVEWRVYFKISYLKLILLRFIFLTKSLYMFYT